MIPPIANIISTVIMPRQFNQWGPAHTIKKSAPGRPENTTNPALTMQEFHVFCVSEHLKKHATLEIKTHTMSTAAFNLICSPVCTTSTVCCSGGVHSRDDKCVAQAFKSYKTSDFSRPFPILLFILVISASFFGRAYASKRHFCLSHMLI